MKRLALMLKILLLGLLMTLILVGCQVYTEDVNVSKFNAMVGEQVELSVVSDEYDQLGCSPHMYQHFAGNQFQWSNY